MVPSICHTWYYTTSRLVNSEGNGNFSGSRLGLGACTEVAYDLWLGDGLCSMWLEKIQLAKFLIQIQMISLCAL